MKKSSPAVSVNLYYNGQRVPDQGSSIYFQRNWRLGVSKMDVDNCTVHQNE